MTRLPTPLLAIASIALAALMASHPGTSGALAQAAPGSPNYSSHAAAFFTGLLEGRVWILERPNSRRAGDRNTVWAHYHGPDGTLRACAHLGGAYAPGTARWRVVPSREFRALYNFNEPGVEPDPGQRRGHTPVFYDPATGVLHNEALGAASGVWAVASRGWVQESWPRAMKDACPDLRLPADLPVNENQTSTAFDKAIAQDPDAPLRGFPGSELRGPGATGIAASGGHATLPAAALKRFLEDNDGRVLVDNTGARHVLVLGPDRDELWLLDGSGGTTGAIADTGHLVPAAGGAEIALHYERLPLRPRFRVGDALPLLPTGERYAAMRLTDWLAARSEPVTLPFMDREDSAFRFGADGTLTAVLGDGNGSRETAGAWRWSRGELIVTSTARRRPTAIPGARSPPMSGGRPNDRRGTSSHSWRLPRGDGGGIGCIRAGRGFTVRAGDAIRRGGGGRLHRREFKAGSFRPAHGAIHGRCECRGPQPSASRAGRRGGRATATGRPGEEARTPNVPIPKSGIPTPPMAASVIAGCPRDLLTRLLAGVANKEDALSALAIEHEILKLCHERQLIVTGIFETEAQLRALRAPAEPAAANRSPAVAAVVPSVMPQLNTVPAKLPAPSTAPPNSAKAAPAAPRYGWFSIVGMAGDLRAGVTDGRRVWFVREGDPLPGDVRVGRIAARPPGVQIEGADDSALPYRARPGDGS